jgi:SDR family mycofactocin-dependent oxidoreductase
MLPGVEPDLEYGRPTDRVALVTGAARGIGAATVLELCRQGYAVTALDVCSGGNVLPGVGYAMANRANLESVAQAFPDQVLAIESDVRDREALESAVNATLVRFGRLDAVVAAAGIVVGGLSQWETPEAHLQTLLDVNVLGVWNTAAVTVPVMLAGPTPGESRFVAVASAAGERGLFKLAGYVASKHAVIGIVRGLAADLVGTGLAAIAVAPGSTDTPMLAATADLYDTTPNELAGQQGIRRLIAPEEIAATIALCCSPAGAALNGSVIRADGGFG